MSKLKETFKKANCNHIAEKQIGWFFPNGTADGRTLPVYECVRCGNIRIGTFGDCEPSAYENKHA